MRTHRVAAAASLFAGSLLAASLVAAPGASAAPAKAAPAKKFASCAALNKVYPHGVGVAGAKDKGAKPGKAVGNYTRNLAVYKLNAARLDRDKDGIACEK